MVDSITKYILEELRKAISVSVNHSLGTRLIDEKIDIVGRVAHHRP